MLIKLNNAKSKTSRLMKSNGGHLFFCYGWEKRQRSFFKTICHTPGQRRKTYKCSENAQFGGFYCFASFQNRLQAAAIYKKRNKKGKPKVILTDDTLHRTIFIWPKSSSPLLRFYDTSIFWSIDPILFLKRI